MAAASASVRYMIDDVPAAIAFYTEHLGFSLQMDASPAFAAVTLGPLRLLLSGPGSSGADPVNDGTRPVPGGWSRILVPVDDIEAEVTRLRAAGLMVRKDVVKGVGGSQALIEDPSGNPVELFQAT